MPKRHAHPRIRRLTQPLVRAAFFGAVWWIIAEADPRSWLFGLPFVILATVASLRLTPSRTWRIKPLGALRYGWYFIHRSVLGGIDVALRALKPSLPLDPAFIRYRTRLDAEHARVLFANTLSLLPGTLSTGFEGDWVTLHAIDHGLPVERSLEDLEERVAGIFGIDLDGHGEALGGAGPHPSLQEVDRP